VLLLCAAWARGQAKPLSESEKIEALITQVDGMTDAVFVRNGKSYDGHAAASHLREKWQWKKNEIKTARDFIRIIGSASSQSGKPYLIRFRDGREVKSGDFLSQALDKLEGRPAK
jgi:hypothetical protein